MVTLSRVGDEPADLREMARSDVADERFVTRDIGLPEGTIADVLDGIERTPHVPRGELARSIVLP